MNETITARGVVYGKVQGVWFRAFTREQAERHKLGGYARNQADGTVAFALCGPRNAVETVLEALRLGPPLARVSHIDVTWLSDETTTGFETS
jgi:acylphosphatase